MSSSQSLPPRPIPPIPFEKPYHKPSYLLHENSLIEIDKDKTKTVESLIVAYKQNKYVQVPGTDNILYKMTAANNQHVFLQICVRPYTAQEHAEAQALRAKKLGHLDFLSRQLHKGNAEAILHQMQQLLNLTPSLKALERIKNMNGTPGANVVGIYQIAIPSNSTAARQNFAFTKSSNNYTSLYLNFKKQKKQENQTKQTKYYPIPKLPTKKTTKTSLSTSQPPPPQSQQRPPQPRAAANANLDAANLDAALAASLENVPQPPAIAAPKGFTKIEVANGGWCFYDSLYEGLIRISDEYRIDDETSDERGLRMAREIATWLLAPDSRVLNQIDGQFITPEEYYTNVGYQHLNDVPIMGENRVAKLSFREYLEYSVATNESGAPKIYAEQPISPLGAAYAYGIRIVLFSAGDQKSTFKPPGVDSTTRRTVYILQTTRNHFDALIKTTKR